MRIVEAPCKFCKKPLHLEVDEDFLEMRPDLTLSAGGEVVSLLHLASWIIDRFNSRSADCLAVDIYNSCCWIEVESDISIGC